MPLPRLGCGGPSHHDGIKTPEIAALAPQATDHGPAALGKMNDDPFRPGPKPEAGPQLEAAGATEHTHVPPTLLHAMPLPRLGCGGPSQDKSSEVGNTKVREHMETPQFTSIDPAMYEHCENAKKKPRMRSPSSLKGLSLTSSHHVSSQIAATSTSQAGDRATERDHENHSPVTVKSDTPTISDTVHFQPVLKGHIQWMNSAETFWYAADLPAESLERVWELGTCCQFTDLQEEVTACMTPMKVLQADDDCVTIPRHCVQILIDQELTLLKVEPHAPLLQQQQIHSLAATLYDQFGQVTEGQTTDFGTVLTTEPLTHGVNAHDLVYVFAAFSQTNMSWHVCKLTNTITASFTGDRLAVEFLQKFFMHALTTHSRDVLGRKATVKDNGDLVFAPSRSSGVMPPNPFLIALSIAAAKTLLDGLETEADDLTGRATTIKWAGRPVWQGRLQANTMLATIEYILRMCFRMICDGVQSPLDSTIQQLPINARREDTLIHAVMAIRGGGQGTKMQQRAIQQNALASTLLDHGFNLAWTTKAVETIMDKFGLGKLQSVNSQPMGNAKIQAVLTLCKEAGVTIPELSKPKSGNEIPGSFAQKRKKRAADFKLNPSDYTLVDGFFTKGDGSEMQQVSQIIPQSCGICILTSSQAEVWVREGQKISADELGLLVLGSITVPSGLASEEVTFPSYNSDKQMVLLTATLIQLGAKNIQHKQGDPKQVPSESCSLVAVTMYREDWMEDDWRAITTNPTAMVRKQLEAEGLSAGIQAIWGKSLRHQRSPATPIQALTVQVHMTVEDTSLEKLLARSGFNRLFLTPKTQVGRLNPTYKVIWIPGDVPKMTSLTTKCQACLGLVRGRQGKGYGLRFHTDQYDTAWAVLLPGTSPPQNNPGDKVYKLQNLPFGCTKLMLQNWIEAMKWDACPIRALGPQTWIVRAASDIPPGIPMFNSSPILARLLPPRAQQGPEKILLGPRPKPPTGQNGDPWHQGHDPWANYGLAKAPVAAQAVALPPQQGPTEKRLEEQDAKLATMQASLEQLTQNQKLHAKQVESQFKQAAHREQENLNKMDQALKHIELSVDNAMSKSMQQYQSVMDDKFQEIKNLFLSNKRSAPADESDMHD